MSYPGLCVPDAVIRMEDYDAVYDYLNTTCPIQFAPSYWCQATHATGRLQQLQRRRSPIWSSGPAHIFMPVAIETLGAFGPRTLALIKVLGRRIWKATREEKASGFLLQRLRGEMQPL